MDVKKPMRTNSYIQPMYSNQMYSPVYNSHLISSPTPPPISPLPSSQSPYMSRQQSMFRGNVNGWNNNNNNHIVRNPLPYMNSVNPLIHQQVQYRHPSNGSSLNRSSGTTTNHNHHHQNLQS